MSSLRARLILGCSLVAVVPLALAIALLGARIQRTVRAEAAERLGAALALMQARLADDGTRIAGKLDLLARDPQLKRLYLVEPTGAPELREYLAQQQYLLDLDYLAVADTGGRVLADAATAPGARARPGREPLPAGALAPAPPGPGITALVGVPALALDASAPILYRDQRVGAVRGGVVLDTTMLARLGRAAGVELALYDSAGRVVASTLAPGTVPVAPAGDDARRLAIGGRAWLVRAAPLALGPAPHARIAGLVSTAPADDTVDALRGTALLLALLGVVLAVALALVWSRQLSRPIERLAAFSERVARGEWDEPLAVESVRELRTLVDALERMRGDLRTYRDRLTASERQAAYGQMARAVAHEIKNPLTPIAVSVADLKRSYDARRADFPAILDQAVRTIGEEVESLKRLLHEFSELGRFPSPRLEPCDVATLLAELGALYAGPLAAGRLTIASAPDGARLDADRGQLRQALVNLIQNGLDASAPDGRVTVRVAVTDGALALVVADDGPGLDESQRARLFVPGFTTKPHGSGLGLTIVERIVSDHGGTVAVESSPGHGTTFLIRLPARPEA